HQYADESYNISILDKEAVLELASKLGIDGIMSFAVDPGVLTAAYVAEKLNLPFAGSYESVRILQNKDLFRAFLTKYGFEVPASGGYTSLKEALAEIDKFSFPVIVKPVDSAGSKGVNRVDQLEQLACAVEEAISLSFSKRFIIEDYIEQKGYSSDSDCFSLDGKLVFCSFSDQMFEDNAANPYTPAAYVWPNTMSPIEKKDLEEELQRLFVLLDLKSSIYNIETRVGINGVPYIMEVSPRGGGNRISEILTKATGVNLIRSAIQAAVGEPVNFPEHFEYDGVWAELILYSQQEGIFRGLDIDKSIQAYLVEQDLWVEPGTKVYPFTGANASLGTLIFKFKSRQELELHWKEIRNHISIE
ncbi:MAG: ATP-grasp domain-containing protein, partial [Bacteroides sp.]